MDGRLISGLISGLIGGLIGGRAELARRVDAAWKWPRGIGAPRGRRVDIGQGFANHFHAWRVELARRVDAAWTWTCSKGLTLLLGPCGIDQEDTEHLCYIQPLEQEEESSYNHLLFFDFEATQEHGTHCPNLCVVHDEEREVALFQGEDTVKKFCEWLLTPEHKDCIVVAHNFQGYDGYFITKFLIDNAIHYDIIYRGAKSLSMTVPMFNIKFIDSINFIPMSLAKFPKTFGQDELCKGYFPHMFNKEENQNYIGPMPCQNDYGVNFMKPGEREAFIAWHDEQVANNYRYDFREEIIKYCRSDVDIMRKCCLLYREMFRKETDIDPFNKSLTIASYCQEVYRTNFLKKDTIAVFQPDRQLKIKQSNVAVKWLSYISEKEDLCIQHVRNGGEKRFMDYSLDGYCEETHTAYEFQGCFWHGKGFCDVMLIYR